MTTFFATALAVCARGLICLQRVWFTDFGMIILSVACACDTIDLLGHVRAIFIFFSVRACVELIF